MRNSLMFAGLSVGFLLAVACTQEAESGNDARAQSLAVQDNEADPAPPPPPKPPKEAFAACEGKAEGASCTVTIDARTKEGTCRKGPDDGLACAPNDRPPPPPPRPPKEAFAACEGKAEGASCTVTIDARTKEGTCRKGPDDGLACAPNDRRPPPPPRPPKEAFEACEGKAEGASCTVTIDERTKEGTCRKGPDDGLACVPNDRPPPPPPQP